MNKPHPRKIIIGSLIFLLLISFVVLFSVLKHSSYFNKTNEFTYYDKSAFEIPKDIMPKPREATSTAKFKIPILLYHYVENVADPNDTTRKKLDINPYTFEEQLKTLKEAFYTTLFIREIPAIVKGKNPPPVKPIALTFDDGYRDFYTVAYPILQKYQMKATIYVISGFLDWPNYLTKKQLAEIAASGLVEIASHTVHHATLKNANEQVITKELVESKKSLEQISGETVTDFAYPYGSFNDKAATLVKDAGYQTAASVVSASFQSANNLYFLYRLRPGGQTGKSLLDWLEGLKK